MSTIGPPSRPPITSITTPLTPHPGRTVALSDGGSDSRAGVAEDRATREAQSRMVEAQRRVAQAETEAEVEVEHVRDQYDRKATEETNRQDEAINNEKTKGYEALRDIRRNQQRDLGNVRRDGESDVAGLRNYYLREKTQADHQGRQELRDIQAQNLLESESQRRQGKFESEETRSAQEHQLNSLKEEGDSKFQSLAESARAEYERMHANSVEARDQAQTKFEERFQTQRVQSDEIIGRMHNTASDHIREIRRDTSQKLSAYHTRQQDPFYKMIDLNMKLQDAGESYVLTADIPEYEQKHISVAVRGSQLVVSGFRRNEEKLDVDAGHSKGTAAYQSFHEAFPLGYPVDAKRLSREFSGNQLVVTVPKKQEYTIYQPPARGAGAAGVERAKVEKPHFPSNLPETKPAPTVDKDGEPLPGSERTRGSGPLG